MTREADQQSTQVAIDLKTPTLASVDAACMYLVGPDGEPVHLDDLISGKTIAVLPIGVETDFLAEILARGTPHVEFSRQIARHCAQMWMQSVTQAFVHASRRAQYYAKRCAVDSVLSGQDGDTSLARSVSRTEPEGFHRIWHAWPLKDALFYLSMRAVDHVSQNLKDYL